VKLLLLRTRLFPRSLKEELIKKIWPQINLHSELTKKALNMCTSIVNNDRDKLNTKAMDCAQTIINNNE
jgi:hypothetical protein